MSVLAFRPPPRPVPASNPEASPEVQAAQVIAARGIALAEWEMHRVGVDAGQAAHLARMVVLSFLAAYDGADVPAGVVLDAVIDRCRRERWINDGELPPCG